MTKIVMTLLVRNEADILRDNIEFHRAAGVAHFVITDNGSQDATPSIAADYVSQGVADLWVEPEDTYDQARWVSRMARFAHTRHAADWVINNDADEFWLARNGSLRDTLAAVDPSCEALYVSRRNYPPVRGAAGDYLQSMIYRETRSLNAMGAPLPGKLMHRAYADICVAMGNHDASLDGRALTRCTTAGIEIEHFPVRSYAQMEMKIAKGGAALQRNKTLPQALGATWRKLYETWRADELTHWYEEQELTPERLADKLDDGSLTVCTTLRDMLRPARS